MEILQAEGDRREKVLMPTARGKRTLARIHSSAAKLLWDGLPSEAKDRRVTETTELLKQANDKLLGPLQLTFFDKGLSWKLPKEIKADLNRPADSSGSKTKRKTTKQTKRGSLFKSTHG